MRQGQRVSFTAGAGLARYDYTIESWIDPADGHYEGQLDRAQRLRHKAWGGNLRGSVGIFIVRDVSLALSFAAHRVPGADIESIRLNSATESRVRTIPAHHIGLSSLQAGIGFGMHF